VQLDIPHLWSSDDDSQTTRGYASICYQIIVSVSEHEVHIVTDELRIVPFIIFRLHYLAPDPDNLQRPSTEEGIFTELVMEIGLILTTVTCLKPVLRPFHAGYFVRHTEVDGSGQRSGLKAISRDTYYLHSGLKDTRKSKRSALSATSAIEQDEAEVRFATAPQPFVPPTQGEYRATIEPEANSLSSVPDDHNISKTQTFAVEYEDYDQRRL
jgi:hypothetical protein